MKYKLSLSYGLLALLLVAVVSLFSNFFVQKQFEQYVMRQQEKRNEEVVSRVAQEYNASTQSFDAAALEAIGVDALEQGMIVKISDPSGRVLWDAVIHNNGLCNEMLTDMAQRMQNHYNNFQGAYEEKVYPVSGGVTNLGTVNVGYYGPFYYSESDAIFIDTLNRVLIVVGALSLATALLLGLWMARRISRPITQTISAAEKIAQGDYRYKIQAVSDTKELDNLIRSINRLSDELENQDLLRKNLSADIAHELRTPLAALQGNLEAMIDGVWQPDEAHLQSCHEEILRLTRLVNDLEKLSQMERESPALELSRFDLTEAAEKAAVNFEAECLEKNIQLSVSGKDVWVTADRDKIRQVFTNLISNSLKYTPQGGRIEIRLAKEEPFARIDVEDSGSGIGKEHLPFIFERFYRVDRSRSSQSGGAGIGLAIVKAIVEMHGGRIDAQSEAGKGALFRIHLPLG